MLSFEPTYEELKLPICTNIQWANSGFEPTYEELKQQITDVNVKLNILF